jgi:hypothetical protein
MMLVEPRVGATYVFVRSRVIMTRIHIDESTIPPDPTTDWIDQKTLMGILGVSEHTGTQLAKAGRLRPFEHGFEVCGKRRYSRWLVTREQRRRLGQAIRQQDEQLEGGGA